jgi:hypothetical protein
VELEEERELKRYDFVTTFGGKERSDGRWVKFTEVEPYIKYQNALIQALKLQLKVVKDEAEKEVRVARLKVPTNKPMVNAKIAIRNRRIAKCKQR